MYAPFYVAVKDFFERAMHEGRPVPTVFAGPDRAHEELKRVINRRSQSKPSAPTTPQALSDRPTPVPFMSVWMDSFKFDPLRYNPGRIVVSKDIASGEAQIARLPRPMTANVQVDLWAESHLSAQMVEAQIELLFLAGRAILPIDWEDDRWYKPPYQILEHARYLGRTHIGLVLDTGWEDTTDLEEDTGTKEVRRTWRGRLDAFIPYPPQDARIIKAIDIEIYDNTVTPPALLMTETGGEED